MKNYTIKKGNELNKLLGYKGLKSFATLYPNGGSVNAYGWKEASMHTIKHEFYSNWNDPNKPVYADKIRFVATHTTYFQPLPNTNILNDWLYVNGPKSIDECIEYLKNL